MVLVYFDVSIGGCRHERVIFRLYTETTPKTCENFRALCTGERGLGIQGKSLHFKGSIFHRVIPGFMVQGGDFTAGNGTGGESIYGGRFADENFKIGHTKVGQLAMANAGPNTNGSQFFVTTSVPRHLNGKHVVFGEVVSGYCTIKQIEAVETERDRPIMLQTCRIEACGEVDPDRPPTQGTQHRKRKRSCSSYSTSSSSSDDAERRRARHKAKKRAKKEKKKAKKKAKKKERKRKERKEKK